MTQIKATAGKGRQVNPHLKTFPRKPGDGDTTAYLNPEWKDFERNENVYPTYKDGKLFEEDGDFEAELVWQYHGRGGWQNKNTPNSCSFEQWKKMCVKPTRQVWNILPSTQKDIEKQKYINRLTVKKLKQLIADLPDELEVTIGIHSIISAERKTLSINQKQCDLFILNDDKDRFF